MFDWMAWTTPVAVFFISIALMLVGMTVWEIRSPTSLRQGFLPIETTRGDRLFIGLLAAAYVNLIFIGISGKLASLLGLQGDLSIWISFIASMLLLGLILKKG
jgi:predicted small integral membrane protein